MISHLLSNQVLRLSKIIFSAPNGASGLKLYEVAQDTQPLSCKKFRVWSYKSYYFTP